MRALALVAACLGALCAAVPADAARRLIARQEAAGAPAIAGDDVVYAGVTPDKFAVTAVRSDGTARVLGTLRRPEEDDPLFFDSSIYSSWTMEIHASPTRAAYRVFSGSRYKADSLQGAAELFAGPLTGPLVKLTGGPGGDRDLVQRAFDIDGDRIAYADGAHVTVRDLVTGQDVVQLASPQYEPRLAGRYLAYVDGSQKIVVYDVESRQPLYSVDARVCAFDVQADGKLAVARCDKSIGVAWYAPGDPAAHVIAGAGDVAIRYPTDRVPVAIDADTIAYARRGAGLGVTDLAGNFRTLAADAALPVDFDLRGGRLAYATPGCSYDTGAVWLDDLNEPVAGTAPAKAPCRVVLGATTLRASPRVLRIPISCPSGCHGSAGVFPRKYWDTGDTQPFEFKAGTSTRVPIRLDYIRALKRTRTRKLYVMLAVQQPNGETTQTAKRVTISNLPR